MLLIELAIISGLPGAKFWPSAEIPAEEVN